MRQIKFRACLGFQKYEVGSDGSIWSLDFNNSGKRKKMKQYRDEDGYPLIVLNIKGVRSVRTTHKLILGSFIQKPSPKHQVNHKNGIRHDNRVYNLEWVTSRENTLHGWRRGRVQSEKAKRSASRIMTELNRVRWGAK